MMGPTAVSQVVEQIARIVFLLTATYLVIKVLNGGLVVAVGYATFAALIGAFAGLFTLYFSWQKERGAPGAEAEPCSFSRYYVPANV